MPRILSLLLVVLMVVVFSPQSGRSADKDTIQPGVLLKDELNKEDQKQINYNFPQGGGAAGTRFAREIPIRLKAGQPVTITVAVTGNVNRFAGVALLDSTKTVVGGDYPQRKVAQMKIAQLAATDDYTIVVFSNQIGVFEVLVQGPPAQVPERAALEAKRDRLKRELAEVEEALKKLSPDSIKRP